VHPHGQILPFHMRRANAFLIGHSDSWDYLYIVNLGGRIPLLSVSPSLVDLNDLGVVDISAEHALNRVGESCPSIRA